MSFPSVERLCVEWAKGNAALNGVVAGRVATRLPHQPTFPFLTVFRVAGGPEDFDLPVDQALCQWDAYADVNTSGTPDYGTADNLARLLVTEARAATVNVALTEGWLYGMTVIDLRRIDEDALRWARYQVDTLVTVREAP